MSDSKYPIFLSGRPSGEDTIQGGSHNKTAEIITQTIKAEKLVKRVVGLEGEWGSGKSNVIKIIEDQLGDEYYTFIFDSWGNQEDLTRKSFLEQLIGQLFDAEFLTDFDKWSKLENELLSKTSTIHKQRFPRLKSYWVLLTLAVILLPVLASLYDNVWSSYNNLIEAIHFGPFWKPVLSIYAVPFLLVLWAFILGLLDYFRMRDDNAEKDLQKQESKSDTIGKIFYWFQGQEIDSTEIENILEDEPSVKKFRDYFSKIEEDLEKNNKKLVIVFDNIDRLEEEKIKSLWSSIHTFFAEDTEVVNSWIVVPYDKSKLNKHFDGNGFIEKTFATNFRVTPPVVTQWESFLNQSLDNAFGKQIIPEEEKEYVVKLFDILSSNTTIKPRQIINYVNNLVSQYLQWENEVKSGEIKLRYLALFILVKDDIISDPNEEILAREYLKGAVNQFDDVAELDECISALTFGVEKKLANEVLLLRELQIILREGNNEKLKSFVNHKAFDSYFNKAYFSLGLPDKINRLVDLLNTASTNLSEARKKQYWNDFARKMPEIETQFEEFNDNHIAIGLNSNLTLAKKVILRLIDTLRAKAKMDDEQSQIKYSTEILKINSFLKDNTKIKIDLLKLLRTVKFTAAPFIHLVSETKEEYGKYEIECEEKELIGYFFEDEESQDDLNLSKTTDCLNELEILNEKYDLEKISEAIIENLKVIGYNLKDEVRDSLNVLKRLNKKPLKMDLSASFYNQLTAPRLEEDEIYIDAFAIGLANFDIAIINQNFINTLTTLSEDNIEKVCKKIEWYIDYDDLLLMVSENPKTNAYRNLKTISAQLTYNSYGSSRLLLKNILPNYSKIVEKVFDNKEVNEIKLIQKLEGWNQQIKDNTDISKYDARFFQNLKHQDYELIKKITKKTIEYYNGLTKEQILESFKNKDKNFTILENLVKNDLMKNFGDSFYGAFDDYTTSIALETEVIPDIDFWEELVDKMDSRKLKSTYTRVRDIFINDRGVLKEEEILFFYKDLLNHGNLDKRSDNSTLKIVTPMIESDTGFPLFLEHKTKFLEIIEKASEHKSSAIRELQIRLNSDEYKENQSMKEIAKDLKLSIKKDESESNS